MNSLKVLGCKVNLVDKSEALAQISGWINNPQKQMRIVVTLNPEMAMAAQKDTKLKEIINTSDLSVADTTGIRWSLKKLHRHKLKEKIPGVDLVEAMAKEGARKNWRFFFLGAAPGVAKQAANKLEEKYPGLKIVKTNDGGEITEDNLKDQAKLVEKINKTKPDIIIVSFGVPKQEKFMEEYKNKLSAKLAIGAGGTLDFFAGRQKRAPKVFRWLGLEWLWRVILEPRRIKRIYTAVIKFPLAVYKTSKAIDN